MIYNILVYDCDDDVLGPDVVSLYARPNDFNIGIAFDFKNPTTIRKKLMCYFSNCFIVFYVFYDYDN